KRRLRRAKSRGHLTMVLLSEPVYVNAAFVENPQLAEIYALLREEQVDIIMAGDTHAYQQYEVSYPTPEGGTHTAHHIVNGGGGAYLAWPCDFPWSLAGKRGPLDPDLVYRHAASGAT